jgi:hypothetical protein
MYERPLVGDPDAMEALAATLRSVADQIDSTSRGVVTRVDTVTFVGPAGDKFRDNIAARRAAAVSIAGDAAELANRLISAAAAGRAALAAWERQMQLLAERESRST